jgi:hypothetical protein
VKIPMMPKGSEQERLVLNMSDRSSIGERTRSVKPNTGKALVKVSSPDATLPERLTTDAFTLAISLVVA